MVMGQWQTLPLGPKAVRAPSPGVSAESRDGRIYNLCHYGRASRLGQSGDRSGLWPSRLRGEPETAESRALRLARAEEPLEAGSSYYGLRFGRLKRSQWGSLLGVDSGPSSARAEGALLEARDQSEKGPG